MLPVSDERLGYGSRQVVAASYFALGPVVALNLLQNLAFYAMLDEGVDFLEDCVTSFYFLGKVFYILECVGGHQLLYP